MYTVDKILRELYDISFNTNSKLLTVMVNEHIKLLNKIDKLDIKKFSVKSDFIKWIILAQSKLIYDNYFAISYDLEYNIYNLIDDNIGREIYIGDSAITYLLFDEYIEKIIDNFNNTKISKLKDYELAFLINYCDNPKKILNKLLCCKSNDIINKIYIYMLATDFSETMTFITYDNTIANMNYKKKTEILKHVVYLFVSELKRNKNNKELYEMDLEALNETLSTNLNLLEYFRINYGTDYFRPGLIAENNAYYVVISDRKKYFPNDTKLKQQIHEYIDKSPSFCSEIKNLYLRGDEFVRKCVKNKIPNIEKKISKSK